MRKADLAEQIIRRLSKDFYAETWIKYDDAIRGGINFHVDGIQEPIFIKSKTNRFEAARIIADKVVENGFHYGNCELISMLKKHNNDPVMASIDAIVAIHERERIKKLSHKEKVSEIRERYNIVVT